MKMTLVKYRTTDVPHNQYAAVPIIYLSDLLEWLRLSECAEIVEVTDNLELSFAAPITWPAHDMCSYHHELSDIVAGAR